MLIPWSNCDLSANPLRKDKSPVVELRVAFDTNGSYLQTSDKLPLFTVSEAPNVTSRMDCKGKQECRRCLAGRWDNCASIPHLEC